MCPKPPNDERCGRFGISLAESRDWSDTLYETWFQ
jgi:hypothetical protein